MSVSQRDPSMVAPSVDACANISTSFSRTCIFHLCIFVLAFSVLAFSTPPPRYLIFPYLHFHTRPVCIKLLLTPKQHPNNNTPNLYTFNKNIGTEIKQLSRLLFDFRVLPQATSPSTKRTISTGLRRLHSVDNTGRTDDRQTDRHR